MPHRRLTAARDSFALSPFPEHPTVHSDGSMGQSEPAATLTPSSRRVLSGCSRRARLPRRWLADQTVNSVVITLGWMVTTTFCFFRRLIRGLFRTAACSIRKRTSSFWVCSITVSGCVYGFVAHGVNDWLDTKCKCPLYRGSQSLLGEHAFCRSCLGRRCRVSARRLLLSLSSHQRR